MVQPLAVLVRAQIPRLGEKRYRMKLETMYFEKERQNRILDAQSSTVAECDELPGVA